jgi:DNA-binding NarL/FixJ family response regulator
MRIVKIMVVDDHPSVLHGLQLMLSVYPHLHIAGMYRSAQALLEALQTEVPDVVIMDIQMPATDGISLCKQVTALYPPVKVIALTNCEEKYQLKAMLQNGASGYLVKTAEKETIAAAIEAVVKGEQYIHEELKNLLLQEIISGKPTSKNNPSLTKREKEILKFITIGCSNQEVADKLFLSVRTVENHRFNIMQKLDVKNAAGLIQEAMRIGLIE